MSEGCTCLGAAATVTELLNGMNSRKIVLDTGVESLLFYSGEDKNSERFQSRFARLAYLYDPLARAFCCLKILHEMYTFRRQTCGNP
jgi:hypothetical protein